MQSLDEDDNYYKDVLMKNFGVDSESENDSDDDDKSGLRLYKDFMVIKQEIKTQPLPTKLMHDQEMNAISSLWYKLFKNSEDLLKDKPPLYIFLSFWTNDIVSNIADETNIFAKQIIKQYQNNGLYANSKLAKWKPTNPNEIYAYLGIVISMFENLKPKFKDYFDSTIKITLTPGYKRYITEDRFWLLYNLVHIVDNDWFTETLTNRNRDVLQLIHLMHHFCLEKKQYIKVWHRKRFINLLHYSLEQTMKISLIKRKYTFKSDISDSLLKLYKTEDYVKEKYDLKIRDVKYRCDKKFRVNVVNHLPDIGKKPAKCAFCGKVSEYFCPSCDVHLCLRVRSCYKRYPHSGKEKTQNDP